MLRRILYMALSVLGIVTLAGLFYAAAMGYLVHQPTPEEIADDIVARINAEREAQGLETLVINEHLTLIAQWRSQDMIEGDYFSHYPPEGHPTLRDLVVNLGYNSALVPIENIVTMQLVYGRRLDDVAERAVDSWRTSPGHWRWAMGRSEELTGVGVIVRDGHIVITQLFWSGGSIPTLARQYNRKSP